MNHLKSAPIFRLKEKQNEFVRPRKAQHSTSEASKAKAGSH